MAFIRCPRQPTMVAEYPPDLSVRWDGAGNLSDIRRVAVVPVGGAQVSSYSNML